MASSLAVASSVSLLDKASGSGGRGGSGKEDNSGSGDSGGSGGGGNDGGDDHGGGGGSAQRLLMGIEGVLSPLWKLRLQGLVHVTDLSVLAVSRCCPKLSVLVLSGCGHVSERSLTSFMYDDEDEEGEGGECISSTTMPGENKEGEGEGGGGRCREGTEALPPSLHPSLSELSFGDSSIGSPSAATIETATETGTETETMTMTETATEMAATTGTVAAPVQEEHRAVVSEKCVLGIALANARTLRTLCANETNLSSDCIGHIVFACSTLEMLSVQSSDSLEAVREAVLRCTAGMPPRERELKKKLHVMLNNAALPIFVLSSCM
jgi:hypothetical protein